MVKQYYEVNVLKPGIVNKKLWKKEKYFHFAKNTPLKTIEKLCHFDHLENCGSTHVQFKFQAYFFDIASVRDV